jgi:hypothetical protein
VRIVLTDGTSREVPLQRGYTGVRAERVELCKRDVEDIRRLAWNHPTLFNQVMRELASRFEKGGDVMKVNGTGRE